MATIHDPRYRALIQLLVRIRRESGITQTSLATALSKPQSFVAKVENLDRRLDVIEVFDWVRATRYDHEAFFSELRTILAEPL
jgi:hypothetical protein